MWIPKISRQDGPVYLSVVEALAADIASGRLGEGARLPPQRALAETLGVDFTTITRAYTEAQKRGLVEGRVGQGTFVRGLPAPSQGGIVDMSMNMPPRIADRALMARLWGGLDAIRQAADPALLMRYQEPGGTSRDKAAGAAWLAPRLGSVEAERVLVCPGAQSALTAVLGLLAGLGDTVLADSLTYPGFLSLASFLRLHVVGVAGDEAGMQRDALEAACEQHRPKALYCTPTIQNPTAVTWSLERRRAILATAERFNITVIEDDAYGALPQAPLPPLAELDPGRVFHVSTLSKCVAPALRIAYLVVPDRRAAIRAAGALRATSAMASPISGALASRWIEQGTAHDLLAAIRAESRARQTLAASILPAELLRTNPEGFHAWLTLPPDARQGEFIGELRAQGISVVGSSAFAVADAPGAVRLGLGAPASREELTGSLKTIAAALERAGTMMAVV